MASESSTNSTKAKANQYQPDSVLKTMNQAVADYEGSIITSTLAHEIRNPLQTMKIHLELAERKGLSSEAITALKDQLARLELIVTKIQKLSDRIVAKPRRGNLRLIVESTLHSMHFWLAAAGIEVKTHCQWEGEPLCIFDNDLIEQVLLNLCMNSIQAMAGGGTLCVYLREELDHAVIEVSDTGSGIDTALLTKVGTPFFTTKPEGNGLGLAFCKTVAALHGGVLDVYSSAGEGTTVTVRILKEGLKKEDDSHVH